MSLKTSLLLPLLPFYPNLATLWSEILILKLMTVLDVFFHWNPCAVWNVCSLHEIIFSRERRENQLPHHQGSGFPSPCVFVMGRNKKVIVTQFSLKCVCICSENFSEVLWLTSITMPLHLIYPRPLKSQMIDPCFTPAPFFTICRRVRSLMAELNSVRPALIGKWWPKYA